MTDRKLICNLVVAVPNKLLLTIASSLLHCDVVVCLQQCNSSFSGFSKRCNQVLTISNWHCAIFAYHWKHQTNRIQNIELHWYTEQETINNMFCFSSKQSNEKNSIKIYNYTSGNKVPLTWGEIYGIAEYHLFQNPLEGMVWYPEGSFKRSVTINR